MPSKDRLHYLDGIRGWAAAIVVFGHTMGGVIAIDNPWFVNHQWMSFFTNAHLAVLVFFVLSGYVLSVSQLYSSKRNTAVSTVARFFRLSLPIFFVSIVAYAMMKMNLFYNVQAATNDMARSWLGTFFTFQPSLSGVFSFSFFDVFFSYNTPTTYNSSLWTMPIEMAGSLLIYSYVAIFRSNKFNWIMAAILIVYFYHNNPFMFCFMIGYVLAELKYINSQPLSGKYEIPLIIIFFVMIYIDTYHRPAEEKYQSLEAIAFVIVISYSKIMSAIFSSRASRFMGRISFSLYLVQILVICSWSSAIKIVLSRSGVNIDLAATINITSSMAICILLARAMAPIDEFSVKYSKVIAEKILGLRKVNNVECKKEPA